MGKSKMVVKSKQDLREDIAQFVRDKHELRAEILRLRHELQLQIDALESSTTHLRKALYGAK